MNCVSLSRGFTRTVVAAASAIAILLSSAMAAVAADAKPIAVVSIAGVKKLQDDVKYLTAAAGVEEEGKSVVALLRLYTPGIDPNKPIGVVLLPHEGDIEELIFLPVTNLKAFLTVLEPQIGEPLSTEGGIMEFDDGQKLFVKEQAGWAFAARNKAMLATVPQDPTPWLGDMPKTHTIAAKILVKNIPQDVLAAGMDEIKYAFERSLDLLSDVGPDVNPDDAAKTGRGLVTALEKQVNETDEMLFGLTIDPTTKKLTFEVKQLAVDGSDLAKQFALASDTKTNFAGFIMPGAAVHGNFSGKMSEDDVKQFAATLTAARKDLLNRIENDPVLTPERREGSKKYATRLFDLLDEALKDGKIDGGFSVMLEPKSFTVVAGGHFAKAAEFEQIFKDLAVDAQGEPDLPELKANVSSHGGVNFHTVSQAVPEDWSEARDVIGDKAIWTIGTSKTALYVAFGRNGESLLKQVIDNSATSADKTVPPSRVTVAMLPIFKFLASIDERPLLPLVVKAVEDANAGDKILFSQEPVERGISAKMSIEEGVLRPIGVAVKEAIKTFFGNGDDSEL